jgi:hypothetical protein
MFFDAPKVFQCSWNLRLESKEFLPISFKIQLLQTSPQNQKEQKKLGADKLVTTQIWNLKI